MSILRYGPFPPKPSQALSYLLQNIPALPFMWYGRIQDGTFVYANDHHLCHLTGANLNSFERLTRLSSGDGNTWVPFDIHQPIDANQGMYAIFKAAHLTDLDCLGLVHFVRKTGMAI